MASAVAALLQQAARAAELGDVAASRRLADAALALMQPPAGETKPANVVPLRRR